MISKLSWLETKLNVQFVFSFDFSAEFDDFLVVNIHGRIQRGDRGPDPPPPLHLELPDY